MHYAEISKILGRYLYFFSLALLFPLLIAIYYEFFSTTNPHPASSLAFIITIIVSVFLGVIFQFFGRKAKGVFFRKESIILVVMIWLITSFVASIPFYLSKTFEKPLDAYFEAMSGVTTTGATLILAKKFNAEGEEIPYEIQNTHIPNKFYHVYGTINPIIMENGEVLEGFDAINRAILMWRSFLQWLGGLGIVVIFISVLPALSVGGKFLFQMEIPGPIKESIAPRIKETASSLWKLYLSLTIIEILALMWTNESITLFDAVALSFSNISTGGFTTHASSIAYFNSPWTESIVAVFMILGSINFSLYFFVLRGKIQKIRAPDFLLFIILLLVGAMLVSGFIYGSFDPTFPGVKYPFFEAIRKGVFQAISVQTSSGFVTTNYDLWPFPSQMFMLLLMYVGGMPGSTCGGIKVSRFYILFKIISHKVESLFRPYSIRRIVIANQEVDEKTYSTVLTFFCIVALISTTAAVCYILDGIDPETSFGIAGSMVNNIGTAFRAAGPQDTFNILSPTSKIMSMVWMLFGRLEFFSVILLFFPSFWKSR